MSEHKMLVIIAFVIIVVSTFFIGRDYEKWKSTDRYSTYLGAKNACEETLQKDTYVRDHTEVDRGLLLDDCIKYVMNQGGN